MIEGRGGASFFEIVPRYVMNRESRSCALPTVERDGSFPTLARPRAPRRREWIGARD